VKEVRKTFKMNAEKPEYLFPEDNPFKATYTFFPIKSYL
jgi:hypothetical protein